MNDHIQSLKSFQVAPLEELLFWGGSLCHRQEFLLGFGVARGSTMSAGFCHVSCLSAFLVLFGTFGGHFFFTAILLILGSGSKPILHQHLLPGYLLLVMFVTLSFPPHINLHAVSHCLSLFLTLSFHSQLSSTPKSSPHSCNENPSDEASVLSASDG